MHLNSSLFRSQALMAVIAGSCVIPLVGAVAENLQQVAGNNILTVYADNPKSLDDDLRLEVLGRLTALTPQVRSLFSSSPRLIPKYSVALYADPNAYGKLAPPGSSGRYLATANRALVRIDQQAVHLALATAQHEATHLLIDQVLNRRNLPLWLDEGLAEYAEMGVWTGDQVVLGIIPCKRGGYFWASPKSVFNRLAEVQSPLRGGKLLPWSKLLQWNDGNNAEMLKTPGGLLIWDQAWSIVQFFLHAENGKYAAQFQRALNGIPQGGWDNAFRRQFGRAINSFEEEWKTWWLSLPDEPTDELYLQATVAKVAGVLGRQWLLGLRPQTCEELLANLADKEFRAKLAANALLRLPGSLLEQTREEIKTAKGLSLKPGVNDVPMVVLTRSGQPDMIGLVTAAEGRIQVAVRIAKN